MFPIIGEVVIRTNSFETKLTVNAPLDTVRHYDFAALVDVDHVASASYHEFGTIGRLKIADGHAVLEAGSLVVCPMDAGDDETAGKDIATIEVKEGATICEEGEYEHAENGTAAEFVPDCGAGNHDFGQKIIVDNKYVYEICKCCGYTLVHVVDEITAEDVLTTKKDSTGAVVNTPSETYNKNSESLNEDGSVKADATPSIPAVDASKVNTSCDHEFGEPVIIKATCYSEGSKTLTCAKCGATVTTAIAKVPHRFYDNPADSNSLKSDYEEKCIYYNLCHTTRGAVDVCEINGTTYRTLRQALATITDGTPTTITMIADEAIYGNTGYTIALGKDITIDLNGHKICNFVTESSGSFVFTNQGKLTIKDSTDINCDGTGNGVLYNDYDSVDENVHVGDWWATPQYNYCSNVITNCGELHIQSGKIVNTCAGNICYCVDTQTNGNSYGEIITTYIEGGYLYNWYTNAMRLCCNSTTKECKAVVTGGIIESYGGIWVQNSNINANKGVLEISGGKLIDVTKGDSYVVYSYEAYYATSKGYDCSNISINISGDAIIEGSLNIYYCDDNHAKDPRVTISGGVFEVTPTSISNCDITGGKFKNDILSYGNYLYENNVFPDWGNASIEEMEEEHYIVIQSDAKAYHAYYDYGPVEYGGEYRKYDQGIKTLSPEQYANYTYDEVSQTGWILEELDGLYYEVKIMSSDYYNFFLSDDYLTVVEGDYFVVQQK